MQQHHLAIQVIQVSQDGSTDPNNPWWGYEQPEFKTPFASPRNTNFTSVYKAMRAYQDDWLDAEPYGINSTIWTCSGDVHGNGLSGAMIWSTGGGCIGHGKQGYKWTVMGAGDRNS